MKRRDGLDLASLASGLVVIALGGLLLADQAGALDISFAYMLPVLLAGVGGVLLACGLAGPPRRRP